MTIDAHVLYTYVYRSPIDRRASTSFRIKKCPLAPIPVSSNVCDGSDASIRPRYAPRARDLFSALGIKMKEREKVLYFLIHVESYNLDLARPSAEKRTRLSGRTRTSGTGYGLCRPRAKRERC